MVEKEQDKIEDSRVRNLDKLANQFDISGFKGDLRIFVLHLLNEKYLKSQAAIDAFYEIANQASKLPQYGLGELRSYITTNTVNHPDIQVDIDVYRIPSMFGMNISGGPMVRAGIHSKLSSSSMNESSNASNSNISDSKQSTIRPKTKLTLAILVALGISGTALTDNGKNAIYQARDAIAKIINPLK